MNDLNNVFGLDEDYFTTSSLDNKRPNQLTIYCPVENFTFPKSADGKQFIVNSLKKLKWLHTNRIKTKIVYFAPTS